MSDDGVPIPKATPLLLPPTIALAPPSERRSPLAAPKRAELAPPPGNHPDPLAKILAYARLDFDNYTFYIQTLQVVLGRKSHDEPQLAHHNVDVHMSLKKAILRRHAKIFYNFATQQFELSIMGRNGAFVDDLFVEKGNTVPLSDGTKVQFGDILFKFVLPLIDDEEEGVVKKVANHKPLNPIDALQMRTNLMSTQVLPTKKVKEIKEEPAVTRRDLVARRNSLLKIRRLSQLRRKSLATLADNEIDDILKELGVALIDAIEDDNLLGLLDEEVFEDDLDLAAIDSGIDQLDQEIACLQPLIDAHHQELLHEKELQRNQLHEKRLLVLGKPRFGGRPQLEVTVLPVPAELTPMRYKPSLRAITVSIEPPLLSFGVPILDDEPLTQPKVPKHIILLPNPRPVYTLDDIPEQFRMKPITTIAQMITQVLKNHKNGLTLSQICNSIEGEYPYYKYCAEPWQFSIGHNVKHNKEFARLGKNGNEEWVYGLDQHYLEEREQVRRKQQEMLAVRTRDAALRADDSRYLGHSATLYGLGPKPPSMLRPGTLIKDQLAANRATETTKPFDMKKTLAYVQTELMTLYKSRALLFNKDATTEIITKALATTIAQVNAIGAKLGCGDNALAFLVDRAPQQVLKILDIALSKLIKEIQGQKAPSPEVEKIPASTAPSRPAYKLGPKPPSYPGRPTAFSRPNGGLLRPPPGRPTTAKRPMDDNDEQRKQVKLG